MKFTMRDREKYISLDPPLKDDLFKLFDKKDKITIFDIGGCEGEESIRYSRLFPFSSIYIFEPLPKNQELIKENLIKFKVDNVEFLPYALSDEIGVSNFYVSSGHPNELPENLDWDFGNKSSSLLQPNQDNNPDWLNFDETIQVKTSTLKKVIEDKRIEGIDFIHMDVQGAELNVLKGAEDYLKNIKAIWMEVSNLELYKGQPVTSNIENFMKLRGFILVKSVFEGDFGDQFYLNKKYFKFIRFSFLNKKFHRYIKK